MAAFETTPFRGSGSISDILDELYRSIPDSKRISYGRVYTIKLLSEYLYDRLVELDAAVYEIASRILEGSEDFRCKGVGLGMLSFYGLGDYNRNSTVWILGQARGRVLPGTTRLFWG